jgi:hypothetical protein
MPTAVTVAFSRRVGASVFAKNNSPLGDRRKIEGLRFSEKDFLVRIYRPKFARFLGKTTVEIAIFRRLYRSFCKLPVFYSFFLTCSQILAKSSCGVSPVHLPHEIGGKKTPLELGELISDGQVLFLSILYYSQNGDDQQADLIRFGFKLNMKGKF